MEVIRFTPLSESVFRAFGENMMTSDGKIINTVAAKQTPKIFQATCRQLQRRSLRGCSLCGHVAWPSGMTDGHSQVDYPELNHSALLVGLHIRVRTNMPNDSTLQKQKNMGKATSWKLMAGWQLSLL